MNKGMMIDIVTTTGEIKSVHADDKAFFGWFSSALDDANSYYSMNNVITNQQVGIVPNSKDYASSQSIFNQSYSSKNELDKSLVNFQGNQQFQNPNTNYNNTMEFITQDQQSYDDKFVATLLKTLCPGELEPLEQAVLNEEFAPSSSVYCNMMNPGNGSQMDSASYTENYNSTGYVPENESLNHSEFGGSYPDPSYFDNYEYNYENNYKSNYEHNCEHNYENNYVNNYELNYEHNYENNYDNAMAAYIEVAPPIIPMEASNHQNAAPQISNSDIASTENQLMSLKDFYSSLSSNEFVADDTVIDENAVAPLITSPEVDLTSFIDNLHPDLPVLSEEDQMNIIGIKKKRGPYKKRVLVPKMLNCHICDVSSKNKSALNLHVNTVHFKQRRHHCKSCCKTFGRVSHLKDHEAGHLVKEKNFQCQICKNFFKSPQSLRSHQITHQPPKFCCHICDKKYKSNYQLKEHLNIHAGNFEYPCSYCKKTFVSIDRLKIHLRTHAKTKFQCEYCPTKVKAIQGYKIHLMRRHSHIEKKELAARIRRVQNLRFDFIIMEYVPRS